MLNVSELQIGYGATAELLPGDIVSVRTPGSVMSEMTRQFEQGDDEDESWASHSGIMDARSNGAAELIEALWKVKRRPLSSYRGKSRVAIVRCPALDMRKRIILAEEARLHLGERYGWWNLIRHAFSHADRITNPNRPICSYLVAWVYDVVLGQRFGKSPNEIQPDDLLDHAIFNNWPLVWCDSEATRDELGALYDESGNKYAAQLARRVEGEGRV